MSANSIGDSKSVGKWESGHLGFEFSSFVLHLLRNCCFYFLELFLGHFWFAFGSLLAAESGQKVPKSGQKVTKSVLFALEDCLWPTNRKEKSQRETVIRLTVCLQQKTVGDSCWKRTQRNLKSRKLAATVARLVSP